MAYFGDYRFVVGEHGRKERLFFYIFTQIVDIRSPSNQNIGQSQHLLIAYKRSK